jgi:hypothetical protein
MSGEMRQQKANGMRPELTVLARGRVVSAIWRRR